MTAFEHFSEHFRRERTPVAELDETPTPTMRPVAVPDTAAVLAALDTALLAAETAAAQLHARVQEARTQMAIVRARAQDDASKLAKLDAVQRALQD